MKETAPRLLLLLEQSFFDASSGAAVSMRHMAYLLAKAGWRVRGLSTDLTEGKASNRFHESADIIHGTSCFDPAQAISWIHDEEVEFEIIKLAPDNDDNARKQVERLFDRHYSALLKSFQPDLIVTYGGTMADIRRRNIARNNHIRVVFALHIYGLLPNCKPRLPKIMLPTEIEIAAIYSVSW